LEGQKSTRLDGIYRSTVTLFWDIWRNSRWRKPLLIAFIFLTLSLVSFQSVIDISPSYSAATYTGKHARTVEYVLGCSGSSYDCSDNPGTARSDNQQVWAGTSWSTTSTTTSGCGSGAGCKNVVIEGSGIDVRNAYLDLQFIRESLVDVINIGMTMDVEGGPNPGVGVRVAEEATAITQDTGTGTLSGYMRSVHDVTAFFDRQSDSAFNSGLDVVASVAIDFAAAGNRRLTTLKLVVTYEQDYSTTSHNETKTVRFPLDSTTSGDTGTKQAQCATTTTCDFDYNANIPDATQDSDILDVFFEVTAETDSATASTIEVEINGGTDGPDFAWGETFTDDHNINVIYRPPVGGSDFQRSTAQVLTVVTGSVALNIIGGELVVTYRFSTGAATQTDTVRYFMLQQTAATAGTKTTNSALATYISNGSFSVQNIWYKADVATSETNTLTLFGTVGAAAERSSGYPMGGSNTLVAGDIKTIFFDLSADVGSYTSSPTNLDIEVQWTGGTPGTSDAPVSAEAFITFTWAGSSGGAETRTITYGRTNAGTSAVASEAYNGPCPPKGETHRYRFTLYALSQTLNKNAETPWNEIKAALKGFKLGSSFLTVSYRR